MTIYLSNKPSTLVGYYLRNYQGIDFELEVCDTWEKLLDVSTRAPTLNDDMDLVPSINLVIPSFDKPGKELRHSVLNDTYIVGIKANNWNSILNQYNWIENLKLDLKSYNDKINRLNQCLDSSAFKWFKDSFYEYPIKVDWETIHLIIKCKELRRKLTIEDLEIMYGFGKTYEFYTYLRYLGNQEVTNTILTKLDNTALWLGFIGKHAPFIYKELIKRCPEAWVLVDIFRNLFIKGRIDLSEGVFILNYLLNLVLNSRDNKGIIDRCILNKCIEVLETM
jgi:hypothetical protein